MSEQIIEKEKLNDTGHLPPVVFLYVNPLTGKHAKTSNNSRLAVFVNEIAARKWEGISKTLKNMVGYEATVEEMLDIASKETGGSYEYFSDYS